MIIRDAAPHKERSFRTQFERVFHQHAHALPRRLTREEILKWQEIEERKGAWFMGGKRTTRDQIIALLRLDEGEARWLLDGVDTSAPEVPTGD
jgi:hypothetical protein